MMLLDGVDEVSDGSELQFSFGGTHALSLVLLDLLDDWLVLAVVGEDISQWARPTTNLTLGIFDWWAFLCLLCFSFSRCSWEIWRERFGGAFLTPLLILMLAAIEFNLAKEVLVIYVSLLLPKTWATQCDVVFLRAILLALIAFLLAFIPDLLNIPLVFGT